MRKANELGTVWLFLKMAFRAVGSLFFNGACFDVIPWNGSKCPKFSPISSKDNVRLTDGLLCLFLSLTIKIFPSFVFKLKALG